MNHPTSEQLISYFYDEAGPTERAELKTHLQTCQQCARNLNAWRSARTDLNAWKMMPKRAGSAAPLPVLRWALAGAAMLLCFGLGGFAFSWNSRALPAALQARLRTQMRAEALQVAQAETERARDSMAAACEKRTREFVMAFAKESYAQQRKEIRALYAALDKIDSQRAADYVALKKELDTLAVNADAELRSAENGLIELATFTQTPAVSPQE
ncbi:MAG: hypothetical protein C5B50_09435 [Verrucomicrobia bacterium]|nr:MAG: hypothetical protein C5B50_09435 [Verrucomicrobiota bacterium]